VIGVIGEIGEIIEIREKERKIKKPLARGREGDIASGVHAQGVGKKNDHGSSPSRR
jgi:hypothetical protein